LKAALRAALPRVVPTADTAWHALLHHILGHEQLRSLLVVRTSTHSLLRRLVDQETAYLGTNARSAGFFDLFAATEQGIHD